MEIKREPYPTMTLQAFADQHGLTLRLRERAMDAWQRRHGVPRWMADFEGVEGLGDGVLEGVYGNGNTEDAAIADYVQQISTRRLVKDAWKETRQEFTSPRLTYAPGSADGV